MGDTGGKSSGFDPCMVSGDTLGLPRGEVNKLTISKCELRITDCWNRKVPEVT